MFLTLCIQFQRKGRKKDSNPMKTVPFSGEPRYNSNERPKRRRGRTSRQPGGISIAALIRAVLCLLPAPAAAAEETGLEIEEIVLDNVSDEDWFTELFSDEDETAEAGAEAQEEPEAENPARTAFIDDIIERGKKEFEKAR